VGAGVGRVQVRVAAGRPGERGLLAPRQLLGLPSVAWTATFFLLPLVLVAVYSFGQIDLVTFDTRFGWTLANYGRVFEPLYLHNFVRSLVLSGSTTVGCLLVGLPLAHFISRQPPRAQRVLLLMVMIPFWTSFIVRTYAIFNLLDNGGPVDGLARALGLVRGHINFLFSNKAIGLGILYSYLPLMVLPIYVALERIDPNILDAASDLGAGGRQVFRRVILPLAMPGVGAGLIIVGIPAMGEYVIPDILGGGKTFMLGNVVATQFLGVGDYPFGSAIAMTLILPIAVVLVLARRRRVLEAA
jgi:ABC-type spermidine/putrescine transport system permease subunit I